MTTEIEKKFFDAFGIKPERKCYYWDCPYSTGLVTQDVPFEKRDCVNCKNPDKTVYPEITDRILLELIVINNENAPAVGDTLEELRNQVLYWCIRYKNKIYTQVRDLFGVKD